MKKLIIALFAIYALLSVCTIASAETEVVVLPTASGVPQSVITDMIKDAPSDSRITIRSWNKIDENSNNPALIRAGFDYVDISISATQNNVVLSDRFVISVAKGSAKTLTSKWSAKVNSSVSISANPEHVPIPSSATLGVSASIEVEYDVTFVFNGPPESSQYNSRQYRVKFYGDKGNWSATAVLSVNPAARIPISGTWKKPTHYAEYSIDIKE